MDEKPVNFTTIASFLKLKPQTVYVWYREYLSGFPEAVASGVWGKDNFTGSDKRTKSVPVLKPENLGEEMAVDEKMIDEEFYTVLTNRQTGKIALLAETMQVADLSKLIDKMGEAKNVVKEVTLDLSPTYEKFAEQCFAGATLVAGKFHVVKHVVEAVQALRLRCKQEELSKIPTTKKERKEYEKATKLINGESRIEMLTRSRYVLFKREENWTASQQKRAALLFETFPQIKATYQLRQQIRNWLDKSNVGKYEWQIEKELIHWYDNAEQQKLPEVENLIRLIGSHEQKIMNYFLKGKTNAKAEAINSKIQRFITANYGVRDKDFFFYRLARYYS
ncbi:MAG: transposase [Chitinophagaceae bacterium]|nr:transposase [Chitinophagaceae bacterium]